VSHSLAQARQEVAQRRGRVGDLVLDVLRRHADDPVRGIHHAADAEAQAAALDDQVLRQDQLARRGVAHVGVGVRQAVLVDHAPQELVAVVQVALAQADRVVAEARRLLGEELAGRPVPRVAVAEEVAGIQHERGDALIPDLVEEGGPPGQPATPAVPSAAGLDVALDVAGVEDGDLRPLAVRLLRQGGRRTGRGAARGRERGQQQRQAPANTRHLQPTRAVMKRSDARPAAAAAAARQWDHDKPDRRGRASRRADGGETRAAGGGSREPVFLTRGFP
jgi:hypothetical protein